MFIGLLKECLKVFGFLLLVVLLMHLAIRFIGEEQLGHWPDERESKCIGRSLIEAGTGKRNWTDDLGCQQ